MSEAHIRSAERYVERSFPFYYRSLAVREVLWSGRSEFQKIDVVDLFVLGKTLFLDGDLQLSVSDEYIYHETMAHSGLLGVDDPRSVLILGGADGGLLREVVKYASVKYVILVKLDKTVLADGYEYLNDEERVFDVVFMDLTDPALRDPEIGLYRRDVLSAVRKRLRKHGIMVVQSSCSIFHRDIFEELLTTTEQVFERAVPLSTWIPSYGFPWSFIPASRAKDTPAQGVLERRYQHRSIETRYYSPEVQSALMTEIQSYLGST
jgi:spermidine synthase